MAWGDFDGDGLGELAVGTRLGDAGTKNFGTVNILSINPANNEVTTNVKIGDGLAGFNVVGDRNDWFGSSLACATDLDGNGVDDLVVGAMGDDDISPITNKRVSNSGAVYVLYMDNGAQVGSFNKISAASPQMAPLLSKGDLFGNSVTAKKDDCYTVVGAGSRKDKGLTRQEGAIYYFNADTIGDILPTPKVGSDELLANVEGQLIDEDDVIHGELGDDLRIAIWPNPNSGKFYVEMHGLNEQKFELSVTNNVGQRVFSKTRRGQPSTIKQVVNLSDMPRGIYHVKLEVGENSIVKKIVVMD